MRKNRKKNRKRPRYGSLWRFNVRLENRYREKDEPLVSERVKNGMAVVVFIAIIGLLVSLFIGYGREILFNSSRFALTRIMIENNSYLLADDVINFSGLKQGSNIFGISLKEVYERLREHPDIRDAVVTIKVPDTIAIKVYEREPIAQIRKGRYFLIDEECVVTSRAAAIASFDLPVIVGLDLKSIGFGIRIKHRGIEDAVEIAHVYLTTELHELIRIVSINIHDPENIVLVTGNETVIEMGEGDYSTKLKKLVLILEDLKAKDKVPTSIDFRFRDVPVKTAMKQQGKNG